MNSDQQTVCGRGHCVRILNTQVSPSKPEASKLLAEVIIYYLDKLHGEIPMQAPATRQSSPILLGTRIFHSFHSRACMHGSDNHGATLHVIGPRIGSDGNSFLIIANQPWKANPAAVGARARAAGIEGWSPGAKLATALT
jgi:hypothetical protein